jgi:hypothetical protein
MFMFFITIAGKNYFGPRVCTIPPYKKIRRHSTDSSPRPDYRLVRERDDSEHITIHGSNAATASNSTAAQPTLPI